MHNTGYRFGIVIHTSSRRLNLRLSTEFELLDWLEALISSIIKNPYCRKNDLYSFSPIRGTEKRNDYNYAQWYINAYKYFEDIADCIKQAEREIYITDWWLSPNIYLKRPVEVDEKGNDISPDYRLDILLKEAAERKVRVFVLLYKEFEAAIPNNSAYSQSTLMSGGSEYIKVIRHPKDLIFFWSHHEKMVVIDQRIGFMGGIDLCYGRYDLDSYPLFDPSEDESKQYFFGQDYNNVRIKDFKEVENYKKTLIDKSTQPRMPWRDVGVQLRGHVVKDLTRHFIQYWNFAKYDIEGKSKRNFLHKKENAMKTRSSVSTKRASTTGLIIPKELKSKSKSNQNPKKYDNVDYDSEVHPRPSTAPRLSLLTQDLIVRREGKKSASKRKLLRKIQSSHEVDSYSNFYIDECELPLAEISNGEVTNKPTSTMNRMLTSINFMKSYDTSNINQDMDDDGLADQQIRPVEEIDDIDPDKYDCICQVIIL